jgi:hypothetical protein
LVVAEHVAHITLDIDQHQFHLSVPTRIAAARLAVQCIATLGAP